MTVVVVAYYRVSTEEQSRKGFSLPEQRRECRARAEQLAQAQGARLQLTEFEDAASGEVLDRPGLEACRAFLRQTPVHYFICLDPDRFARSLFLQLLVTEEIEQKGVQLLFIQHQYEKTAEGRLFYQMRGAIAEYEKAKIKERTARGRRGKLAAGGIPVFVEPWGYRWDRQNKALRVDPAKAPWVVQLFEWFVAGLSYQQIAAKLSELGVAPPKGGRTWYRNAVSRILHNPVYAGRLVLNRGDYEGLTPLRKVPRARRRPLTPRLRPPEQWVTVEVPALIPAALWQRAQSLLAGRRRLSQRGAGLLSGLCACGLCGRPIHYARHHGRRYLRCRGRYGQPRGASRLPAPAAQEPQESPCRLPHLPADPLEAAVWQQVREWLLDPQALQTLQRRQADPASGPSARNRAAALQAELSAREATYRRAFALAVQGLAPEGYDGELRRLQAEVGALRREAGAAAAAAHAEESAGAPMAAGALAAEVEAALDALDPAERRKTVRMLISRIAVWPRRWEYLLRADASSAVRCL